VNAHKIAKFHHTSVLHELGSPLRDQLDVAQPADELRRAREEVARRLDHWRGEHGAAPERREGKTRGHAAPVREPAHERGHRGNVPEPPPEPAEDPIP
jgi:hypothetical protein